VGREEYLHGLPFFIESDGRDIRTFIRTWRKLSLRGRRSQIRLSSWVGHQQRGDQKLEADHGQGEGFYCLRPFRSIYRCKCKSHGLVFSKMFLQVQFHLVVADEDVSVWEGVAVEAVEAFFGILPFAFNSAWVIASQAVSRTAG